MSCIVPFPVLGCLTLPTAQDTCALAEYLAPLLAAGDVILLEGPIGAGKSHFCRCLIRARLLAEDRLEDIPSPTFTLVQTYALDDVEIWHSDLFRLTSEDEATELGLQEAFDQAICLVEWPDRLGRSVPAQAMLITLSPSAHSDARQAVFYASDPRWAGRLDGFSMRIETACD